jgi:hypothetical protein
MGPRFRGDDSSRIAPPQPGFCIAQTPTKKAPLVAASGAKSREETPKRAVAGPATITDRSAMSKP